MTEVAVRLAEPDRAAGAGRAASLRPGRAPPGLLHERCDLARAGARGRARRPWCDNEVAALEKSYGENEHKIKGLIQELAGERHALREHHRQGVPKR